MRLLVLAIALAVSFAAGVYLAPQVRPVVASALPATTVAPTATVHGNKGCRDACDERAVLERLPDNVLRLCRARCDVDHPIVIAPHEVPTGISVAPADHRQH